MGAVMSLWAKPLESPPDMQSHSTRYISSGSSVARSGWVCYPCRTAPQEADPHRLAHLPTLSNHVKVATYDIRTKCAQNRWLFIHAPTHLFQPPKAVWDGVYHLLEICTSSRKKDTSKARHGCRIVIRNSNGSTYIYHPPSRGIQHCSI